MLTCYLNYLPYMLLLVLYFHCILPVFFTGIEEVRKAVAIGSHGGSVGEGCGTAVLVRVEIP